MADTTIRVAFVGDTKDFSRAVNNIQGSTRRLESGFGSLTKRLGTLGKLSIAGLGAKQVVDGLIDITSAAADEEQEIAKLNRTLRNAGVPRQAIASVDSYVTSLQNTVAVADSELRPALATLTTSTKDLGEAQKLLGLALDIAAAKGVSVESVAANLAKAQNGQLRGLRQYGVNLTDASGKTVDFAQAQERLGKAFKGSAATAADTTSGRLKTLSLRFDDLKERIGAKLLPVVEKVANFFLEKVIPFFEGGLPDGLKKASGAFDGMSDTVEKLRGVFEAVVTFAQALWAKFGNNILEFARRSFGPLKQTVEGALNALKGVFDVLTGLITGDWEKFWDGIKRVVIGVFNAINGTAKAALEQVRFIIGVGLEIIGNVFKAAWEGIQSGVAGAFDAVREKVEDAVGWIAALPGRFASAGAGLFDWIADSFRAALNFVIDAWNNLEFQIPSASAFGVTVGGQTIGTPNIPRLASGGIVTGPTVALIGEAGPEAVIPLNRMNQGVTVIVQGDVLDGNDFERHVANAVAQLRRRGVSVA